MWTTLNGRVFETDCPAGGSKWKRSIARALSGLEARIIRNWAGGPWRLGVASRIQGTPPLSELNRESDRSAACLATWLFDIRRLRAPGPVRRA